LWHTGRSSNVAVTGGPSPVSAPVNTAYWENPDNLTSTPSGWKQPSPHRALEVAEIAGIVGDYRQASVRAKDAGFDGVQLHAANGYLPDQFLQDSSNKRTDGYGGSTAHRTRFVLDVVEVMASVFGSDRVAVRIGPDGKWNQMGDSDSKALFDHLVGDLNRFALAYFHVVEPRVKRNVVVIEGQAPIAAEHLRTILKGPIVAADGFEADTAEAIIAKGMPTWLLSVGISSQTPKCRTASNRDCSAVMIETRFTPLTQRVTWIIRRISRTRRHPE